jgi:hypothetical protein
MSASIEAKLNNASIEIETPTPTSLNQNKTSMFNKLFSNNNVYASMTNNNFINNQLKLDLEQQNAIKLQQMEAIKLIQISLDKLTSTTTVQIQTNSNSPKQPNSNSQPASVLVYKEANLHKNLLVSKILNKAKYFYYQSIVQTMRLSLISKLNYYSSLIQQLNGNSSANSSSSAENSFRLSPPNNDETTIVDEMKLLMQQILHETYQFNLNTSINDQIDLNGENAASPLSLYSNYDNSAKQINKISPDDAKQTVNECTNSTSEEINVVDDNNNNTTSHLAEQNVNNQSDQIKRIKQLNDVKLSLYSLLFTNSNTNANANDTAAANNKASAIKKPTNSLNNFKKRLLDNRKSSARVNLDVNNNTSLLDSNHSNDDLEINRFNKRARKSTSPSSPRPHKYSLNEKVNEQMTNVDLNNNSLILSDDTNVIDNRHYHNHHHHHLVNCDKPFKKHKSAKPKHNHLSHHHHHRSSSPVVSTNNPLNVNVLV